MEAQKRKPTKPVKCAMCGVEGHSPIDCVKIPNYDTNYPANHQLASNYKWWLNFAQQNFSNSQQTSVSQAGNGGISWANLAKSNLPQNYQPIQDAFTWPGRRNEYVSLFRYLLFFELYTHFLVV